MSYERNTRGWVVALAGAGINLANGALYSWSVIKGGIPDSWGWSNAGKALPYSLACLCFSLAMIPAGRLQDKFGPRIVATLGGILVGGGFILSGFSGPSLTGYAVGFGVLTGFGIGFGYAAATPAAVKWFPKAKTGMIAGIVVSGFGLASVYVAPLATWLLKATGKTRGTADPITGMEVVEKGVSPTMLTLGIGFLLLIALLAQLLKNPPAGSRTNRGEADDGKFPSGVGEDLNWKQMLSKPQFYILWVMFFAGAAAGLTFISVAQDLGKRSLGELAFLAVVVLAMGNASGRILAGGLSDRLGRQWMIFGVHVLQAMVLFVLFVVKSAAGWPVILVIILLIGANFGANLALFPAASKDFFGMNHFGLNYGLLFSAWGLAGLTMPWLNGRVKDLTGSSDPVYFIIIALLLVGTGLTFVSRRLARRPSNSRSGPFF